MASNEKALKGYIKTENMIMYMVLAIAISFIGGVAFSTYKSTRNLQAAPDPATASSPESSQVPLSQEQSQKLDALIQATQATPENVNTWTQLGHFYFDSGNHAKAVQAYEKSLELDASRPDVWTDLGVMYRRTDNPKKAVESFDRAISLNAHHEIAMFNKGVVLMHDLKDPEAALSSWETLIQVNPNAKTPSGQLVKSLVAELKKSNS